MQIKALIALAVTTSAIPVFGQGSPTIVGGGYTTPTPLTVAPGQLITIFVTGIGKGITQRVAAIAYPLPTTLAGISVSFTQAGPQGPQPVPLLAVFPVNTCAALLSSNGQGPFGASCSILLGITIQIPFELNPNIPGTFGPDNIAEITASDGTNTTGAIQLNPVRDRIHILRYGDTVLAYGGVIPLVTHSDGSLVSPDKPAKVGETLVLYAVGLGVTNPRVKTGDASPLAAATAPQIPLIFDYRPNATPSSMLINPQVSGQQGSMIQSSSLFAGLTPGYAGLYQVNFQVPAPPGPIPACANGVNSNLTVNLIGSIGFMSNSSDGAEICVTK